MKHKIYFFVVSAVVLLMTACDSQDVTSLDPSKTREITFSMETIQFSGSTPMRTPTRAVSAPTYLLVLDELNGSIVSANTVERTVDALTPLTMNLTYGDHTLYFLACKNSYASFNTTDMTVTWGGAEHKLNYVWVAKKVIHVDESTAAADAITLDLAVAQVQVQCNDAFPANTGNMRIQAPTACWTLNLRTLQGVAGEVVSTADASSFANQTEKALALFTFVPASGNIGDMTLTVYNNAATPQVLATHTLEDVPVKLGYISHYTGLFFSHDKSFSFSYENEWRGTDEYTY